MPDLLSEIDPGVAGGPHDEAKLQKTVGFIDSLLKYRIFQRYGKCLLRSLVLFRFLRRQGWPVEIHFGVRKTGLNETGSSDHCEAAALPRKADISPGDITGHSWLFLNGQTFLESDNAHSYQTTYSFPGTNSDK